MTGTWPRTTFHPIMLGTILEVVGMGLMAWACWTEKVANVYGFMALIGVGFGLRFMAGPLHGIGLFRQHRASVLALMALSIPLGGTLGLTVMSAVFNNTSGLDTHDFNNHGDETSKTASADLSDDASYNAKVGDASGDFAPELGLIWNLDGCGMGFCRDGSVHLTRKFFLSSMSGQILTTPSLRLWSEHVVLAM